VSSGHLLPDTAPQQNAAGFFYYFIRITAMYTYDMERMQYNIKGTGLSVTDEIRGYVEKKLEHIEKFIRDDASGMADVECEYTASEEGPKYRAEFMVSIGKDIYRAEARGETLHEALDVSSAHIVEEVRRAKKKRLHVFRSSAAKVKEYLRGWRTTV